MRLYGYMRCSGHGQIDGDTWARQKEAIEGFIQAHGLKAELEFGREAAVSGTKDADQRPLFATCLQRWADGENKPDAVVVERLDRFARDLMVQECALRDLKRLGIKVFSCDHGLVDMADDTSDPTRVLIRQVFGAIAQYDKSVTVKKLAAARERIRATGVKCEGRKFYGEVDPTEQAVRLRIISARQIGLKFRFIEGILREEGFRHPDGSEISQHTCKRVWNRYINGTDEVE